MAIVFKVVRRVRNRLLSASQGDHTCTYQTDKMTVPSIKDSLLLAFDSDVHARAFLRLSMQMQSEHWELWKASGEDPTPIGLLPHDFKSMTHFWRGEIDQDILWKAPPGTVGCPSIILTQKLNN